MTDSGTYFETEKHLWTCEAGVLNYLGHGTALCMVKMTTSVSIRCAFLYSQGFVSFSLFDNDCSAA